MECVCCNKKFVKKTGGFKRVGLFTKFKKGPSAADLIMKHFDVKLTPGREGFICSECSQALKSVDVKTEQLKEVETKFRKIRDPGSYISRKVVTTPGRRGISKVRVICAPKKYHAAPKAATSNEGERLSDQQQATKSSDKQKVSIGNAEVNKALRYITQRHYMKGVKILVKYRVGFKRAMQMYFRQTVREEVARMSRKVVSLFKGGKTMAEMEKFSWEDRFQEVKTDCPLLTDTVVASLTSASSERGLGLASNPVISVIPTVGALMSIILYQRKPRIFKEFQEFNSLQFWLSGCKRELLPRMNHLGVCLGIKGTRSAIDRIRSGYDKEVLQWKRDVADQILLPSRSESQTIPYEEVSDREGTMSVSSIEEEADSAENIAESGSEDKTASRSEQSPMATESGTSEGHLGYTLCFDNVNQKLTVRHQVRDKSNKMLNMVQGYAAQDRIPTLHLSDAQPDPDTVLQIPLSSYLPSDLDEALLRSEITVTIMRILGSNIPIFQDLKMDKHIRHPYQKESSKKSNIVPLGIIDKDESKTADMVEIMDIYQRYVPQKPDGSPFILPLYADGLSCERGNDAQSARINGTTPWTQLQGMKPSIQEWHKRVLLLQDAFDELYSGSSARDKGTLFQLQHFFNHRNVTNNVKEEFDHCEEFLEFCCTAYVVLAALHVMKINNLNDVPENMPNDKYRYMERVATEITDMCFLSCENVVERTLNQDEIQEDYQYCICKEDIPGATMIFCDNKNCTKGNWFHLECMEMAEEDVPDDKWYCSEECRFAKSKRGKSGKRRTTSSSLTDHKRDYALMVMYRGLNQKVRRDAIRENDGELMIRHWKFDMLQFFDKHHPKYFLQGQRLLSAVNGAVSPRLRHTLIWNRTVSTRGGQGTNIAMDLHMEHLNNEYKASVKDASGMLTAETIARHSQMVGIDKTIGQVYETQVSGLEASRGHRKPSVDKSKDIKDFINLMGPEEVFVNKPGRRHQSYPDFQFGIYQSINLKQLNGRLVRLRKEQSKRLKVIKQMQDN